MNTSEERKYLEYSLKKPTDILEYEDAMNTLSGSSSFGSLKEIPTKIALARDYLSSEGEEIKSKQQEKASDKSFDSQESDRDEYLRMIQGQVSDALEPVDAKIQLVSSKLDRLEQVHTRKLKKMQKQVGRHQKETQNLDIDIEIWCK